MSAARVPITFLDGHSSRRGVLVVITVPDAAVEEVELCRIFSYSHEWGRLPGDLPFRCRSLAYLDRDKAWWVLGRNGQVAEIIGGAARVEHIPGAGLDVERDERIGYVSTIKTIAGELYVCGYGRQVYKREDAWRSIAADIVTKESATGFFDLDGHRASSLYAVGWKGEIYHLDENGWRRDESPTEVHLAAVRCVGDGEVWACGNDGVVLHGRFQRWRVLRDEAFRGNWYSLEEFGGAIYLASNHGIARVEGDAIVPVDVGLKRPFTARRLCSRDGLLWSIGAKDVLVFDGNQWSEITHPDNIQAATKPL